MLSPCHPPVEGDIKICYITYKGMSCPFSYSTSSGTVSLVEKWIAWVFPSLIFMFKRSHHDFTLQWGCVAVCREHDIHVSLLCKYRYCPRTEQDEFQVSWGIIYVLTVQYWSNVRTLRHPCRCSSWCRKFAIYQDFKFSVSGKRSS
jgi:hypothetical protein